MSSSRGSDWPVQAPEAEGTLPSSPHRPESGEPGFGPRYRVEREVGHGGMGCVYAAVDLELGRRVAIKVLPPGPHGENQLLRFRREARAAGSLNHPNVLTIFDLGTSGAGPYIVSELLEGETLRARMQRGRISPAEASGWALQLAEGICAAHAKGIVHRDLKPENLFITADGRLKVLDFGIAKCASRWKPARRP